MPLTTLEMHLLGQDVTAQMLAPTSPAAWAHLGPIVNTGAARP